MGLFNVLFKKNNNNSSSLNLKKFLSKDSEREIIYFDSGLLKCETELNGKKRNGFSIGYHENGTIEFEGYYEDDKKTGKWKFYGNDGSIQSENIYDKDQLHGEYVHYFSGGSIRQKGKYEHGYLVGNNQVFYENGQLKDDENFSDGRLHGWVISYDQSGNVVSKTHYQHGNETMPNNPSNDIVEELKYCLRLTFQEKNLERAEVKALELLRRGVDHLIPYLCMSAITGTRGDWRYCEMYSSHGLKHDRENEMLLNHMGVSLCEQGKVREGLKYLAEGKKLGFYNCVENYNFWVQKLH